jgi:ADP-ribose pyrophosphatase
MFSITNRHTVGQCHHLALEQVEVTDESGVPFNRCIVQHPRTVAVVALDASQGLVTLVSEYRVTLDRWLLEVPGGVIDAEDTNAAEAAVRELSEEAGIYADSIIHLGDFFNSPGHCTQQSSVFLAQSFTPTPRRPDGPEEAQMRVTTMPLADLPLAIKDGRICDAKTIMSLYYAQIHLNTDIASVRVV